MFRVKAIQNSNAIHVAACILVPEFVELMMATIKKQEILCVLLYRSYTCRVSISKGDCKRVEML
jgi:hypothetical protein